MEAWFGGAHQAQQLRLFRTQEREIFAFPDARIATR